MPRMDSASMGRILWLEMKWWTENFGERGYWPLAKIRYWGVNETQPANFFHFYPTFRGFEQHCERDLVQSQFVRKGVWW